MSHSMSRIEDYLENLLGADHELEPPQSRIEALIDALDDVLIFSGSINESGLIAFTNSDGGTVFSIQLPLYDGSVVGGGA